MLTRRKRKSRINRLLALKLACPDALLLLRTTLWEGADVDCDICRFFGMDKCADSWNALRKLCAKVFGLHPNQYGLNLIVYRHVCADMARIVEEIRDENSVVDG